MPAKGKPFIIKLDAQIKTMDKYIKELISNNDTVIIPKFGALLVTVSGKGIIMFNEHLKFNDGLLVGHVSKTEGIDKDEAQKMVDEYAYKIMGDLDTGEPYSIDGLGAFFKDGKGEIQFNQYRDDEAAAAPTPVEGDKEAEKKAADEKAKAEKEKLEAEKKAADEKAKAEKEKLEAEKKAADEKVKAEKEKLEAEKKAADKKAKAEKEKLEAEKKAADEKAKAEKEKLEAEKKAADEKVKAKKEKLEAEKKAADEKAKAEKEKLEAEKKAADEKAKAEKKAAKKEKKAKDDKKKKDDTKVAATSEDEAPITEVPDLTKEAALAKEISNKAKPKSTSPEVSKDKEAPKNTLKEKKSESTEKPEKKEETPVVPKPDNTTPKADSDKSKTGINPMDHVAPQAEEVELPPASVEKQPKKKKKRLGVLILLLLLIGLGTFTALKFDLVQSWFDGGTEASAEDKPKEEGKDNETAPDEDEVVEPGDLEDEATDPDELEDESTHEEDEHANEDTEQEDGSEDGSDNTESEDTENTQPEPEPNPEPEVTPEPEPAPPTHASAGASGQYHLIASAFRSESNADTYVNELRGMGFSSASKLGKVNGLYQVAAGSYSSMSDAKAALTDARNKTGKSVWIMKY